MTALVLVASVAAVAGAVAGATRVTAPGTFSVTRLQAEEVAAVVGFLDAYNRADLEAALSYFTEKPNPQIQITVVDCDYRRHKTKGYAFRQGVRQWLRERFADHDRLTLTRVWDENPTRPIGIVGVDYARRTSDTLRKLGFRHGIVPQIPQRLSFVFEGGVAKFPVFAFASPSTRKQHPECALVPARR